MIIDLFSKFWKILPREARRLITRSIHHKFTASVVAIVRNDEGKILLLEHVLRPHSGWGLPGGFIEAYEQPEAALRRELKEEIAIELRSISLYRCRTLKQHVEIIFLATAAGEARVNSREIKQFKWVSLEEMPPEMSLDQQFLIKQVIENAEGV